jgi:hypothetical protein
MLHGKFSADMFDLQSCTSMPSSTGLLGGEQSNGQQFYA